MNKKFLLYLFLLHLSMFKLLAFPADSCVRIILNGDEEKTDSAAWELIQSKEIKTFAFIAAILERRLLMVDGIPATRFPGNDTIYEVYPSQYRPVSNYQHMEEIVVPRKTRVRLNVMAKYTNLVSPDPEVRLMGYQALKSSGNTEDIPVLQRISRNEKDERVAKVVREVVFVIWLSSGNAELEKKALDSLSVSNSYSLLEPIENYIEKVNPQSVNHEKAMHIKEKIVRRQKRVSWLQNLFSGLSLGSILLLVALGLSIIYGLGGVINMSHGEFMMIGAYTTFSIQQLFLNVFPGAWFDTFFLISLPLSFLVAGIFGVIIEQLVVKYLYNKPLESLLATWGISLILIQFSRTVFGDVTAVKSPDFLSGGIELTEGLMLPFNRIFVIGLTILMVILTYLSFFKSRLGLKIRAVTQNRSMSAAMGISTKRVDTVTFFLGSGLAGVAGCAMTLIGNVVPNMGQTYIVDSFLVVVVGGVGKLLGTILSAMGIGVLSKVFEFFFQAVYGKVILLVIIIFFLQYKPKGLFPDKGRTGDDD